MKAPLFICALAVAAGAGSPAAAQNHPPNTSAIPAITLNGSPPVRQPAPKPAKQQSAWNTALVGHSDLQGRSAYQALIISQDGRHIAYVGHHTGKRPNPLTGAVEGNGTSIVDVTNAAKPKYLAHIPGPADGSDEAGGAQMVRVCSGSVLPKGEKGKWYLLRAVGSTAHEIYDVTDGTRPTHLTTVVDGLTGTHKSWWECDTGIAYLVGNKASEGWRGNHMKIFDLSDPAKPVYIRDFGLSGQQPDAKSFIGTRQGVNIHGPISAGVAKNRYFIPAPNKNTMAFCSDGVSHPGGDPKITPACIKVIQTNNAEADDRGLIYSADRAGTGLHIIRLTGRAAQVSAK